MFEWNDSYSVGIASIDAQHQNLFRIAGELYAAMSAGRGKAATAQILERLVQYTVSHFAHEERLMRLYHYPGAATHKVEHDALTRQVKQFQAELQAGRASMSVQLLQFLKDWLVKHIQGSDLSFAPYLRSKVA